MNENINSPWGNLVGIRPVKRVVKLLDEGKTPEETAKILKDDFFVTDEKISLSLDIAKSEIDIIKGIPENAVSIYIDIPFCPSKCAYCSFASMDVTIMKDFIEPYLNALYNELDKIKRIITDLNLKVVSIYIGGGTPTSILSIELDNLLYKITNTFDLSYLMEFTVEAGRPDTITESKLEVMKKHGVDRISINPQTMNDKTLVRIGRKHTVDEIYKSYELAKKFNFKCINMDIIAGLPDETVSDFSNTVDKVLELNPENVTVHTMSIKRASRINQDKDFLGLPEDYDVSNMITYAHKKLYEHKFKPYYLYRQKNILGNLENTGFFRDNTPGIYNICMMEEITSVLSAGVGAVTKLVLNDRIERVFNVKDVREYLNRADEMIERKNYIYEFYKKFTSEVN
ncbi:MAG: coproporphyrinogen dehydrogenase HemZ [Clostridia bacterium]|nr:coproporphyrinogen dehydrogenase HemZ [Clostridia bacterium]